ncbi:MAG: DUF1957 domain-containing protein, partial [Candidatus Brocadiia bacterium]
YFEPWVNGTNDWIYPRLHRAERRMAAAASTRDGARPLEKRALDQAARELLLAQASDWPFLMYTGTAREYATRRFRDLMDRFDRLLSQVEAGTVGEAFLSHCERTDDAFPEVDARLFGDSGP